MKATLFKDISDASEIIELEIGKPLYSCFKDAEYLNRIAVVNGIEKSLDYIIQEDDVVIIRTIPGGSAIAIIYIVVLAVSAGVAVYAGVQAYKARKQAEELADKMKNIDSEITNIPYIKGASNATATGKSQPYIIGKHLFTPYKLAEGFNEIAGTYGIDQYYYLVLQGGFNKQVLRKVYCDDILIKTFSESLTIPQEGVYTFDKTSIFNNGNNSIVGIAQDGNSRIEIAQDGNDFEIVQFNKKVVTQSTGDEIKKADAADYEELIYSLEANTRSADICIMFNGLRAYNDSGDKISRSVTLVPEYSLDSGGHWTMFAFVQEGIPNNTFTYNLSQQLRFNAHVDFNYSSVKNLTEPILIRLNCTTPAYDGSAMDSVYVQWVQSYIYNPDKSAIVNAFVDEKPLEANEMAVSTLIGLKIKATLSNQEKLNKINIRTTGVARTWNGTAWSTTKVPTSNPAAWLLEVLTSPTHKASMCSDDEIDLPSFGELYTYCEINGLHCNTVLTDGDTKEAVLSMLLDTCNSIMYHDIYGKISTATDKYKENAIAVINTQNVLSFKNKRDMNRYTDGIRINYINSEEDYINDTYLVMRDGETRNSDSLIREFTVTGIEEYSHVVKYARRLLAIDKLRPKTTSVTIGKEGVYYTPLGKVLVQHPSLKIGLGSAEIKSIMVVGANIVGLELYEPIQYDNTIASGFGVLIQAVSDEYCTTLAKSYTADNGLITEIAFVTPIALSATTIPHAGDILSYGYLNEGAFDTITSPMLITGIEPNQEGYTLTLVDYNEAIYTTGTIPDYTPNITSRKTPLALPVDIPSATKDELANAVNFISLGNEVSIPDDITILYVIAGEERIDIDWSWKGRGLNNNIANYVVEISKNNGVAWTTIGLTLQTSYEYVFNRDIDGYPETDILADWKIRVKAVNIYGKESANYKTVDVDLTHYKTWIPVEATLSTRVNGRGVTLGWGYASEWYGRDKTEIQIAKGYTIDAHGEIVLITDPAALTWYSPALGVDPYASYESYREGAVDGFLSRSGDTVSLSLPLYGQNEVDPVSRDTPYYIRLRSTTFVPTTTDPSAHLRSGWTANDLVYAQATSAQDVVRAWKLDDHGDKVKIDGALGAQQIYAEFLAAISANLGVITDGALFGSENNMWALSRILKDDGSVRYYEGTVRMGGADQYLKVTPVVSGGVIVNYNVDFKVGSFSVTATGSEINGNFVVKSQDGTTRYFEIDPITGKGKLFGNLQVFRTGNDSPTSVPVFDTNPGSAAGAESTTVRGALRVRKSTAGGSDGETEIFNVTPNGDAFLAGKLDGSAHLIYRDDVLVKGRVGLQFAQHGTTDGDFANPTPHWYSHIILNHDNTGGFYQDIMTNFFSDNVFLRRMANGDLSSFRRFLLDNDTANSLVLNLLNGTSPYNYVRYDGWVPNPGIDANTMVINRVGFTYANNAPYIGPIIYLGSIYGDGDYGIQFNATYYNNSSLAFRTHNGDNNTFSAWTIIPSPVSQATGSEEQNFPIGHTLYVKGSIARNASATVYIDTGNASQYTLKSGGAALYGTWRASGSVASSVTDDRVLMRRVA